MIDKIPAYETTSVSLDSAPVILVADNPDRAGNFDEGASLVSDIGHGGIHLWADENVFNTGDLVSLRSQSQQPLVLMMNCLNGYFHFPHFDSLGEAL